MRCVSCNVALTDFEATRKGALSGQYLDLCNKCIAGLGIATLDSQYIQSGAERSSVYEDPDYSDFDYLLNTPVLREDSDDI